MGTKRDRTTWQFAALVGVALSSAVLTVANAQQAANAGGPMVREGATTKLSEHVFIISDNNVPGVPNVGIIVGKRATLVVDTGLGKANGLVVLHETQKVSGKTNLYLVTTHVHPEHDLGAHAFPATTKMIRSQDEVNEITEFGQATGDAFRKRSPVMKDLLEGAEFRKADIVFEKEHILDLGGVHVRIVAVGPNHTPGDTAIFVVEDKVLFSGDVAMKGLPAFASPKSSLTHWLVSLDKLEAFKPTVIVPSHGPTGDAQFISNYRAYLSVIRDRTVALKREGKNVEQVVEQVSAELKSSYPEAGGRATGAIRTAYTEAT